MRSYGHWYSKWYLLAGLSQVNQNNPLVLIIDTLNLLRLTISNIWFNRNGDFFIKV